MNKQRPINLDMTTMRFPVMAITSILHRISGIGIFILTPLMMWYLDLSLRSSDSFKTTKTMLAQPIHKFLIWAFLVAISYHIIAGLRHIIMDMGWGESVSAGRKGSVAVILLSIIMSILAGIWIW